MGPPGYEIPPFWKKLQLIGTIIIHAIMFTKIEAFLEAFWDKMLPTSQEIQNLASKLL
jgi:hypothetical protein